MFMPKKEDRTTMLYDERGRILTAMTAFAPEDPEYKEMMHRLQELEETIANYRKGKIEFRDWVPVIGSVGGILLIIAYEAAGNTITSKAFGRVLKS